MARGTKLRNVRVPDSLWDSAMSLARSRGETVTSVITEALQAYVESAEPGVPPESEITTSTDQ